MTANLISIESEAKYADRVLDRPAPFLQRILKVQDPYFREGVIKAKPRPAKYLASMTGILGPCFIILARFITIPSYLTFSINCHHSIISTTRY